ncbi:MAG: AI-2E family transporter [Chloroflexota bacterium]
MLNNKGMRSNADWQRALLIPLTILAWVAVLIIAAWILSHIVKTVLTLVFSAILAFALTPLVSFMSRWLPKWLSIALAYILGFAIILGLGAFIVVSAAGQVTSLVHHLPSYGHRIQHLEPQIVQILHPFGVTTDSFHHAQKQAIAYLQGVGTSVASQSLSIITGIVGTIVEIILVLILSVYLTANGERIGGRMRTETPLGQRRNISLLIAIVNQVVGGYIRGTLTLATLIGVLVGVGMYILGVPYAVLLGILAFFMEFVPVVGVLISGAISILAAISQGWLKALIVLIYFVFIHVIEGDLVGPRIMGRAVGIHPATAIIALVAGTELFGVYGALFASPLAGLVQAIGTAIWREMRGRDPRAVLHDVGDAAADEIDSATETQPEAASGQG